MRTPSGTGLLMHHTVSYLTRLFHGSHIRHGFMSVSNTPETSINAFSLNFQDRLVIVLRTIWNIFGMLHLSPWIQDFFYFLNACLLATSRGLN